MAKSCTTLVSYRRRLSISSKNVIFVAAENAALAGGKVGGVGDVIRDLPEAVSLSGWPATVITPSYGSLHELPGAQATGSVIAEFRGDEWRVRTFLVPGSSPHVRYLVLDHELLVPTEAGIIYHDDAARPFATDADKFAFFCAAAAAWIESQNTAPAAVHLHDWHAALLTVLRRFDSKYAKLQSIPLFFTIHNLSYQGQRPLRGDVSSLESWYPDLRYEPELIIDPHHRDAINPMAAAIRLADRVNTVSPTYAEEIQQASEPARGFIGGEGLESELQQCRREGRLFGILNGCDYAHAREKPLSWTRLAQLARQTLKNWNNDAAGSIAYRKLSALSKRRPLHLLTSVGRVVDQKMRLFFEQTDSGQTALEDILDGLGTNSVLLLLGSGEPRYEKRLIEIAGNADNFVYFRGYSDALGNAFYAAGDLFLMPSSFEPCGISQMLAMRAGQPCVVHGVGGLSDTVNDRVDGFVFNGRSPRAQANQFATCVADALRLRASDPLLWQSIRDNAAAARFDWAAAAKRYIEYFYDARTG